ncbi:MAG TPA: hypothetical protein VJM49_21130 [Acidimicrobiales bacterium]|nr:hypothetical protein [Acidimicrobiales bacterium]
MPSDHRLGRVVPTVRFRITALATVAVAVVLSATAVALVLVQRRALTDSLDESLTAAAQAVDAGGDVTAPAVDDDAVAQVAVDGDVVAASPPSCSASTQPPCSRTSKACRSSPVARAITPA